MQFETIHPFLDGNGRIGRLLIVLQLVADGVLREPLLYPSLFFKTHRALYYELLNEVRLRGDWERWLDFFAEGIAGERDAGGGHGERAARAGQRRPRPHRRPRAAPPPRRWRCTRHCSGSPSPPRRRSSKATGLTPATVNKSLAHLERDRRRGRADAAAARPRVQLRRYVELLNAELERCAAPSAIGREVGEMSQFAFLQAEWPAVFDAAGRAETAVHADPRTACFYARRALELAVAWAYKHDAGAAAAVPGQPLAR